MSCRDGLDLHKKGAIFRSDPSLKSSSANMDDTDKSHRTNGIHESAARRRVSSASSNGNGVSYGSSSHYHTANDCNSSLQVQGKVEAASQTHGLSDFTNKEHDICTELAFDVVFERSTKDDSSAVSSWLWNIRNPHTSKEDNKYVKTMRRTVSEISDRHEILFSSMVKKLDINRDNFEQIFNSVVDDIFSDGQINWGRIVTVYALGGKIAQFFAENSMDDCMEPLAQTVGHYVAVTLGEWIHENGGWVSSTIFLLQVELKKYLSIAFSFQKIFTVILLR